MDSEGAVQLAHLVRATLEPYATAPDRIELLESPQVSLTQDHTVPVSLMLHELATNAVKYGALSTPTGHLRIGWTLENPNGTATRLSLKWRETGGPAASAPDAPGFGTRLIDFAIARDLGGSVERTYEPEGLYVEVRFPL
jgi:two-component sensor histidine kinase